MAAVLAGEAAVRIVPTLKDFHSKVRQGLRSQPHSISVEVNPNLKEADAQMAEWRARQRAEGVHVPVKADYKQFQKDLTQVEHIFQRSSLHEAIRINLVVAGLDALPALAYAAGSAASGLDALGKSAFALPGLLGGALASAGALAVGVHGVSDALKAYAQDSKSAADNARKQQDADRDLISAKRNLQTAIRDQKREIQDLNTEMRRSSLNEADAILSIQEDVDRLRQGGFKSITEYQRAQLSLRQDLEHLSEVRTKNTRTLEDANKANADGVMGSDRVADALDRVSKAAESLDESKVTKVSEALAKLSPNAQATVQTLHALSDEWKKIVQAPVQDKLFDGLDRSLQSLAKSTLPTLGAGLSGVATGLNSNLKAIMGSLGSDKNTSLMSRLFGNTQGGLENASKGMGALTDSLFKLVAASSNVLPRLGDAAAKVFGRFDAFITRISGDGSLNKWIDQGLKALDNLGNAAINIVSIVDSISNAFDTVSGHSGGFLTSLESGTKELADFLKSTKGQTELIEYFKQAKGFVSGLMQAFKDIKPLLHDVVSTARDWSKVLLDTVGTLASVAGWIERNTGLLEPLIAAYLTFRTVKPIIEGVAGAWKNYNTVMTAVANQGGVLNVTKNRYEQLKTSMDNFGLSADQVKEKTKRAAESVGGEGKTSLFGSLKNVASVIGPQAVFLGSVIVFTAAISKLGEAHERSAQQAQDQAAALDQLKGSLDSVTGASTTALGGETAKKFENFTIPGVGNVNVNDLARQVGLNPSDVVRAASDPSAQDLRNTIQQKLDKSLEDKIAASPDYQKWASQFADAGITPHDIALATRSDPAALAKYRAFMDKSQGVFGVGGHGALADIGRAGLGSGNRLPSLTDFQNTGGAEAKVGFALGTTSASLGDQSRLNSNAAIVAGGRYQLSPAGQSALGQYQPDAIVRLDPRTQRAVVRLNSAPSEADLDKLTKDGIEIGDRLQGGGVLVTLPANSPDIQKFAQGGLVGGIGGPTDDLNLVRTSPGEHVAQAKAVNYYGTKVFDDLNNMRIPKHAVGGWPRGFAPGGFPLDPPPIVPRPVPAPRLGPPSPEPIWGGRVGGPPVTSLGGLAPMDVPNPVAPPVIAPTPIPVPSSPGGFNLGGAGSGGGRLNGSGSVLDSTITPTLPVTMPPGQRLWPGNPGKSITPGSLGAIEQQINPNDLTGGPAGHWGDFHMPAKPTTAGATAPHNSAFDAYMSTRAALPPGQRGPIDDYWRAKGFNPGAIASANVPAPRGVSGQHGGTGLPPGPDGRPSLPHIQTPLTGVAPAGQTPIYGIAPGPGGPVVAPNGPVMGQMRSVIDSLVGTPYVWGGNSPAGVDCSGLASVVANVASGRPAFSGRFGTATEGSELASRGFLPGKGGQGMLTIGWNDSHTAITLPDGTSVSSGEGNGNGVQYGGGGANEGQFTNWMHLPVDSGALDALSGLGAPGAAAALGGGGPGGNVPGFLQPKNIMNFLGGQAQNVGSGIKGIGLQLFGGLTGINLGPLLSAGDQLGNGLIGSATSQDGLGGLFGGGGGGSGLNGLAGADLQAYDNGQLALGLGGAGGAGGGGDFGIGGAGFNPGGGAEQWRPIVRKILNQVGPKYGITNEKAWEDALVKQITSESHGDPNSLNTHDSNGQGGTQTVGGLLNFLPSTFNANNIMGGSFSDPSSQIAAAIPYVIKKYGMNQDGSPKGIGEGHGFATGGYPEGMAFVSKGEYRSNPDATKYYGAGLYNALNSMSIPKNAIGGFKGGGFPSGIPRFEDGGWTDFIKPPAPTGQAKGPLPATTPKPPAPPIFAPGGQTPKPPGQAAQPAPGPSPIGAAPMAAAPSTGGPPGPGATAPAPDPGGLPQVTDALAGIGLPGGGGEGNPQPGATPGDGQDGQGDPRGTLGAAPTSQDHNNPALSAGIQGAFTTVGSIAAMAAQTAIEAGSAGATMGAGAPAGAAAGAAAAQGIQAGAQMAGQIATGAVNILSSLFVGSATPGSTASASGVPLLPQRQPMQSGVPAVNQRNHYGDVHVTDLDEFARRQQRMDAQDVLPYISKFND